jgi:hypothetical protein
MDFRSLSESMESTHLSGKIGGTASLVSLHFEGRDLSVIVRIPFLIPAFACKP